MDNSAAHNTHAAHVNELVHHKSEEMRLREHICQLKTIRATIQGTVVELEPVHNHHNQKVLQHQTSTSTTGSCSGGANQEQLEMAVFKQELMASKEEIADLKAKIYVSEKEKSGKFAQDWK